MTPKTVEELVASVELWIKSRAKYFSFKFHSRVPEDDLAQEGRLWAFRSAKDFDQSRGIMFITYCRQVIDFQMMRYCKTTVNDVRVPNGRFWTNPANYTFLDDTRDVEEGVRVPAAFISDLRPDWSAENANDADRVMDGLRTLSPKEQDVIMRRFFKEETLREVGEARGVTRQRIEQIEKEAIRKLRFVLSLTED